MLRTTSVSPLDRDKDRVLDRGKKCCRIFPVPFGVFFGGGVGSVLCCFVLRTTSVSPLDRDKDRVLDHGKKCCRIFPVSLG